MSTSDLLYAIGEADENYVEEAAHSDTRVRRFWAWEDEYKSRKGFTLILQWSGVAAMFLVCIVSVWLYAGGERIFRKDSNLQENSTASYQKAATEEITSENFAVGAFVEETMEIASETFAEEECQKESVESAAVEGMEDITADINHTMDGSGEHDERMRTVMISSFGGAASEEEIMTAAAKISDDMAVENGSVWRSPSLSGAVEYYGDHEEYRYRVFVELFQDGVQIAGDGEIAQKEAKRLAELGYVVAVETCSDGEVTKTYFTLHATAGQVKGFVTDAEVGYALWLYDERVEGGENATGTVNVWYGSSKAADMSGTN